LKTRRDIFINRRNCINGFNLQIFDFVGGRENLVTG
jgi:hypothetical protein